MSGNLKVIAKPGTPEEAHLLRNRLEAAGIRVFLEGETTAAWAWHFTSGLGSVKLLVPEEDLEAAQGVLAPGDEQEARARAAPAEDQLDWDQAPDSWTCAECQAEVDLNMDVCWACGATREGAEASEPPHETAPEAEPKERGALAPELALVTVLFPPAFAYFLFTKVCHLLAPLVPDARPRPEHAECADEAARSPEEQALDDLVLRAWRAALMGFFLLPPLLMTLYSAWLLVQYWLRRRGRDRRRDRLALWTLGVNVASGLCLGVFVAWVIDTFSGGVRYAPGTIGPASPDRAPYVPH